MERSRNASFQALQTNLQDTHNFKYEEKIDDNLFDVVIYDKIQKPFAIVEIREKVGGVNKKALGLRNNLSIKFKVYVVIHKEIYKIYDISKNSTKEGQLYNGKDLLKAITTIETILKPKTDKEIEECILNNLHYLLYTFFTPSISTYEKKSDKRAEFNIAFPIQKIKDAFVIDKKNKIVKSLEKSKNSFETLLLNVLIDDLERKEDKIRLYRYSTLDAIFSTIKYFTYRLNGIQGMNDQKEGLFFEELFKNDSGFNERINDIFISSCSTKYDNLTMWRLYGDNSQGASITIELTEDYKSKPFYIKKLFYRSFDRIKTKIQFLNAQINELEYLLDSKMFSLFPFFIKSNHYNIEDEVRILYDRSLSEDMSSTKCEWGISEPYKIIRPYVDINIFKDEEKEYNQILPFTIKEIILGPNCPFSKRNIEQIKHYLKVNGVTDVIVKPSKIDKDTYIG